jgi:hypothetical protein
VVVQLRAAGAVRQENQALELCLGRWGARR